MASLASAVAELGISVAAGEAILAVVREEETLVQRWQDVAVLVRPSYASCGARTAMLAKRDALKAFIATGMKAGKQTALNDIIPRKKKGSGADKYDARRDLKTRAQRHRDKIVDRLIDTCFPLPLLKAASKRKSSDDEEEAEEGEEEEMGSSARGKVRKQSVDDDAASTSSRFTAESEEEDLAAMFAFDEAPSRPRAVSVESAGGTKHHIDISDDAPPETAADAKQHRIQNARTSGGAVWALMEHKDAIKVLRDKALSVYETLEALPAESAEVPVPRPVFKEALAVLGDMWSSFGDDGALVERDAAGGAGAEEGAGARLRFSEVA